MQSVSNRTEPSSYSDPDNLAAVAAAAVDEAKYLRQRVQQLELELGTLRKDRARTAPRLPSLRSLVQPEGLRRYSQPCPTCGQSTQLLENELNHPNESPVLTAHSPSSRSTGSENDTWSGSGNISTLSAPSLSIGSATAASFGGHAILQRESGNMQPSGAAYPVVLPSLRVQSPHTACYECRSRNLQVCIHFQSRLSISLWAGLTSISVTELLHAINVVEALFLNVLTKLFDNGVSSQWQQAMGAPKALAMGETGQQLLHQGDRAIRAVRTELFNSFPGSVRTLSYSSILGEKE